jgi:hypothetical protein
LAFASAAILTIVVSLIGQPVLITQLFILVQAVAILARHGALDLPIAQALWLDRLARQTAVCRPVRYLAVLVIAV